MAAPILAAGAAGSSAGGVTSGTAATAFKGLQVGQAVASQDDNNILGWALGGLVGLMLLVLGLPLLVMSAIAPVSGGAPGSTEQIGSGSPIPAAFVPIFNTAASTFDVNPYLLASVADQESTFGTDPGWNAVNSAGCVGFMQTCVGGRGGDSWDSTVSLTGHPTGTIAERFAFRLATRPQAYPLETATHPSYDDPFDAVLAAAVRLRGKVGGRPIPQLNQVAVEAACNYYGACADSTVNYASDVITRARQWESESALTVSGSIGPVSLPTGSRIAQIVSVATQIAAMHIPYCYGGGHAAQPGPSPGIYCHTTSNAFEYNDPEPGLDCSGAVRWLLVSVGYSDPGGIASGAMGSWLQPGPGRYVTVYYNLDHTFASIDGRYWGTSDSNYRGGAGWVASESTAGYAEAHPAGL